MVVNKLFLNGAVEAFTVGIHFGGSGTGVVMDNMLFFQLLVEVFLKLAAIVS